MRYSFSLLAIAALGAQALPQDVQPITQISDGQVQVPPATVVPSTAPPVPTLTDEIVTPSVPVESGSGVVPTVVVPTTVIESELPTGPVVVPTAPANSTGAPTEPSGSANGTFSTGVPTPTGGDEEPSGSPTESGEVPSNTDSAAVANMVSFGSLVLAIGGALFI